MYYGTCINKISFYITVIVLMHKITIYNLCRQEDTDIDLQQNSMFFISVGMNSLHVYLSSVEKLTKVLTYNSRFFIIYWIIIFFFFLRGGGGGEILDISIFLPDHGCKIETDLDTWGSYSNQVHSGHSGGTWSFPYTDTGPSSCCRSPLTFPTSHSHTLDKTQRTYTDTTVQ